MRSAGGRVGHLVATYLRVSPAQPLNTFHFFLRKLLGLSASCLLIRVRAQGVLGDVLNELTSFSGAEAAMTRIAMGSARASAGPSNLLLCGRRQRSTSTFGGDFALLEAVDVLSDRGDHKNEERSIWRDL